MKNWEVNFDEDRQVWDSFVAGSPHRSIFAYSKFLDSLQVNYALVSCYNNGEIIAGAVIVFEESGSPISKPFPFTQYQGILLADNSRLFLHSRVSHEFKIVEFLIAELEKKFRSFSFCQSWRLQDLRPFQWHNYHHPEKGLLNIELRYTGILDLSGYDDFDKYFLTIRTLRKREFKKSSQFLQFDFSTDVELLDILHERTFLRQGIMRSQRQSALLRSISEYALSGGYGKLGLAKFNGVPVSAALFLYDDRTAYYLFGANDPEFRHVAGGTFLQMHMIKNAFEAGVGEIDFVGVNSPNRGDFKISLNAMLQPYFITSFSGSHE